MTCDVDIEACEREVAKLTIVIEEDAGKRRNVNGMPGMKRSGVGWKGPGGETRWNQVDNVESES